jgi:hypothetical protein
MSEMFVFVRFRQLLVYALVTFQFLFPKKHRMGSGFDLK